MSYIGTVALWYIYVARELCSVVPLPPLSLAPVAMPGDLHEIGGPLASRAYADLSLEWKSRIEIFSSAQQTRACACVCVSVYRVVCVCAHPPIDTLRIAFLGTRHVRAEEYRICAACLGDFGESDASNTNFPTFPIAALICLVYRLRAEYWNAKGRNREKLFRVLRSPLRVAVCSRDGTCWKKQKKKMGIL